MEDTDAPLAHLLPVAPNDETSAFNFFETLNLRENAYAEIQRNAAGDPIALWNLDLRKTEPVRLGVNGTPALLGRKPVPFLLCHQTPPLEE